MLGSQGVVKMLEERVPGRAAGAPHAGIEPPKSGGRSMSQLHMPPFFPAHSLMFSPLGAVHIRWDASHLEAPFWRKPARLLGFEVVTVPIAQGNCWGCSEVEAAGALPVDCVSGVSVKNAPLVSLGLALQFTNPSGNCLPDLQPCVWIWGGKS